MMMMVDVMGVKIKMTDVGRCVSGWTWKSHFLVISRLKACQQGRDVDWLRRISYGNCIVGVSHVEVFSMMSTVDIIVWKIVVGVAQHWGNRIGNGV